MGLISLMLHSLAYLFEQEQQQEELHEQQEMAQRQQEEQEGKLREQGELGEQQQQQLPALPIEPAHRLRDLATGLVRKEQRQDLLHYGKIRLQQYLESGRREGETQQPQQKNEQNQQIQQQQRQTQQQQQQQQQQQYLESGRREGETQQPQQKNEQNQQIQQQQRQTQQQQQENHSPSNAQGQEQQQAKLKRFLQRVQQSVDPPLLSMLRSGITAVYQYLSSPPNDNWLTKREFRLVEAAIKEQQQSAAAGALAGAEREDRPRSATPAQVPSGVV